MFGELRLGLRAVAVVAGLLGILALASTETATVGVLVTLLLRGAGRLGGGLVMLERRGAASLVDVTLLLR